jgi:copper chaperone CopZ
VVEKVYTVPGVSCGHCVKAITDELTRIPGIEQVDVDLATKHVTVRHNDNVTDAQIQTGIEEAGYDIAA